MGDVGRSHTIYAAVDDRQADHQNTVVKTLGKLHGVSVSILFDSGATNSFISPTIVDRCGIVAVKQGGKWQVEYASGVKVAVENLVHNCELKIGTLTTSIDLYVTPLGSMT